MALNVEVKARADLNAVRALLPGLGATNEGELHQNDHYFIVANGRLKLRDDYGAEGYELIHYSRPDLAGSRDSQYSIVFLPHRSEPDIYSVLRSALGELAVVRKVRELWILDNVRIHLDTVEQLGTFIELEAVVDEVHDLATCTRQVADLCERLDIRDPIAGSYCDML